MEPDLDCVGPGELGGVVLHVVVAGFLCVEGVGHGDGLVRSVTGSRVDASLSNSGLTFVAAAASMADFQQAAGAIWNWLAAVHWLDSRLHLFKRVMPPSFTSSAKQASRSMSKATQPFCFQLYSKELYQKSDMKLWHLWQQGNRWSRLYSHCTAASQFQVAPPVCCKSAIEAVAAPTGSPELDKLLSTLNPATGRTRPSLCPTSSTPRTTTTPSQSWRTSTAPRTTQSVWMYWDSVPSTQTSENTASVTVVIFGRLNDSNYKREEHKYNKLGYWRMMEPDLDCVGPGELGGVVLHVVVAGFLCVEGRCFYGRLSASCWRHLELAGCCTLAG